MSRSHSCRAVGGFTLLEMLLGLALLGLITLALFTALRFGTQSWERVEQRSAEVVNFDIFESVLRRQLGAAFPLRVGMANESRIAFEGDATKLKFVTALPSHFSVGGLSLVELVIANASRGDEDGKSVILRHALQNGLETEFAPDAEVGESEVLRNLESATLEYFGPTEGDLTKSSWQRAWPASGTFPKLVRLTIRFRGSSDERELVIPIRLGEEAGCYQASFQRICGPRR